MNLRQDPVLRVRVLDGVSALFAAALTYAGIVVSGGLFLLLMPLALAVGVLLAFRPGRARRLGGGVLTGLVAVLFAIVVNYE